MYLLLITCYKSFYLVVSIKVYMFWMIPHFGACTLRLRSLIKLRFLGKMLRLGNHIDQFSYIYIRSTLLLYPKWRSRSVTIFNLKKRVLTTNTVFSQFYWRFFEKKIVKSWTHHSVLCTALFCLRILGNKH